MVITGEIILGRDPRVDIAIEDPEVSRRHARLKLGDHVWLTDLKSTNGTFVNDEQLENSVLAAGDRIRRGSQLSGCIELAT